MATRMELLLNEKRDAMRFVTRLEYAESLDELDALVAEFSVHTSGDAETVVGLTKPGTPFTVELYEDKSAKTTCKGHIVEVEHSRRPRGGWDIRIVGLDGLNRLRTSSEAEILEATTKDAVTAIATRYKLKVDVGSINTSKGWDLVTGEDDIVLLNAYAKKHNFYVRLQEDTLVFKPRTGTGAVTATWGEDVLEITLRANIDGVVSSVKYLGFDIATEKDVTGEGKKADLAGTSGGKTAIDYMEAAYGVTPLVKNQTGYANPNDAKAAAIAELQERAETFVTGTVAVTGNPLAIAGSKLTVKQAGWPFSGDFLVQQTRHVQDALHGYRTFIDFTSDSLPAE